MDRFRQRNDNQSLVWEILCARDERFDGNQWKCKNNMQIKRCMSDLLFLSFEGTYDEEWIEQLWKLTAERLLYILYIMERNQ